VLDRSKEILMRIPKLSAVVAVLIPFALAAPVAGARADATSPTAPSAYSHRVMGPSPLLSFVPPKVGPLSVSLGPTIIDGQVISPGVNVVSPGITLPPITWSPTS
jgi:hypothetical protein